MSDDPILAALARLEAGQTGLRDDLVAVRAEIGHLRTGFLEELGATRAALMERIDRLQHAADLIKEDIVVNYGASDRVERIAKGASDETRALGEIVRVMQRQIQQLRTDVEQLRDGGPAA